MSDHDEFGAFIVGFLVGGLTGAVVALLLAPQSGEETRTVLKEQAIVLKDKATETASTATAQIDSAASTALARINELSELAKARVTEIKEQGAVVLEEKKTQIGDLVQNFRKSEAPAASAAPTTEA